MAFLSEGLNLKLGKTAMTYKVHPVVVFSILDHFKRRGDKQDRVVGTLLGEIDEGTNTVYIKNCFPVPHKGDDDELSVTVNMAYHAKMRSLHQKVNKREVCVGWYTTGEKVSYISSLIHEVYRNECQEPLLLMVDVNVAKSHRMAIKGYVGKTIKVGSKDRETAARFEAVDLDSHAYEGEKIGVDALINANPPDDNDRLDAPATILSDFENLLHLSLHNLISMVEKSKDYVDEVVEGKVEGDSEIGLMLSHAIAAVPHLNAASFDKMFSGNIQDLLSILYLSNVTRTQLSIADKINGLL